jgi:hypothetical protein
MDGQLAVKLRQILADVAQINEPINQPQKVSLNDRVLH